MDSLRKWFYKPKRDDRSLLAQFFFADETLNMVAAELDSFDGRENPERCSTLVNQLRHAQERVLNITSQIMDQFLGSERVPRGFRVKFPEDVLQDNLAGQLWFGAECLAAGSSIMNREEESTAMRPLARALTRSLETVRSLLRDHCLRYNRYGALPPPANTEMLHESLKIFDRLFAEFELCYVSAMVHVKTPREYEVQQHISVLFSETLQRARRIGLLTQDQVDDYDPALMFAIPRLAIVSGLLIFSNGPLSIDKSPDQMSDMFRPFRTLLHKIRELLWTLDRRELYLLEKLLCTNEDIANIRTNVDISNDGTIQPNVDGGCYPDISEFVTRFYSDHSHCKDMINQIGCEWGNGQGDSIHSSSTLQSRGERNSTITDADYLPENVEILSPLLDGMRRLSNISDNSNETLHQSFYSSTLDAKLDSNSDESATGDKSKIENVTDGAENTFHTHDDNLITLTVEYVETNSSNTDTKDASTLSLNKSIGSSRKSSRNESITSSQIGDLMAFDPLAGTSTSMINPMSSSDNNVLLPDQDLVSNLSDQVTELIDKLSSISYGELPENTVDNLPQIFSFSTNDVSNLVSSGNDPEFNNVTNVTYSPSRNDKVMSQTNMPSTSHGYLILNAISQEPAIMASLSNNSSIIYNEDNPSMISQPSNNTRSTEGEIYGDSISVANANLSCLLLTNEEYQSTFLNQENAQDLTFTNTHFDESSFYSANDVSTASNDTLINQNVDPEKSRFMMEYERDSNDQTPADSGICTENTSLDRSPDAEVKDIDDKNNSNSINDDVNNRPNIGDQTINVSDADESKSEITAKKSDISIKNDSETSGGEQTCSVNPTRPDPSEYVDVIETEINFPSYDNVNVDNSECTMILSEKRDDNAEIVTDQIQQTADETHFGTSTQVVDQPAPTPSATGVLNQRKLRKVSPKNKKKSSRSKLVSGEGRNWSPGRVILQNRSHNEQKTPMKLNLEQFVEDCGGGSCSSQSSATSSFHSDWADDEEIALALQAQEFASRHQTRSKFRSSEDMIHRLFVCIAGVADQLQTNFASDLRNILKSVFLMNQTPEIEPEETVESSMEIGNTDVAESESAPPRNITSIEYEASDSDVITNRGSFDSINSAEEVYADNSPITFAVQGDENEQNAVNERRNSQTIKQTSSQRQSSIETQSSHSINIKPSLDSASLQNSASMEGNRHHETFEDDKIADYAQRRSTRNSSSSLESNNSEILNPTLANNTSNELIHKSNDHGYINESTTYRGHPDVIGSSAFIRERGLRPQTIGAAVERAPEWVPDIAAPDCMRCGTHFTAFRRRHHCRNCGKVFCASCSANSIPLPRFGQPKPVRVCEECFQALAKEACGARQVTENSGRQASYAHR